ncbi:MAG: Uma2 family endonuclease [Planctomycetaceae bacterium]
MSRTALIPTLPRIIYPDSDGEPMAENTVQFDAIVTIKENFEFLFRDDPLVFVAGDLFWYPVEGNNKICTAPDTLVAFGVPKGHRGSYRTWEEDGIAPQVVIEVLSPGNRFGKMLEKFNFYDQYGVEEYYIFDPDNGLWQGWLRRDKTLTPISDMNGWVSPRLTIKFESVAGGDLRLFHPNGERFRSVAEIAAERREFKDHFELEQRARAQAQQRADLAVQRAESEKQRADTEKQRADSAEQRAQRLLAQLRAAGLDPSTESLAERQD